jgi:hypothetical protein
MKAGKQSIYADVLKVKLPEKNPSITAQEKTK